MISRVLSRKEAAVYLNLSQRSLVRNQEILSFKIGSLVRYDKQFLDDYIDKKAREAQQEAKLCSKRN